jgi:hypothetical protein
MARGEREGPDVLEAEAGGVRELARRRLVPVLVGEATLRGPDPREPAVPGRVRRERPGCARAPSEARGGVRPLVHNGRASKLRRF